MASFVLRTAGFFRISLIFILTFGVFQSAQVSAQKVDSVVNPIWQPVAEESIPPRSSDTGFRKSILPFA
jgi:hypothetical protein